MPAWQIEGFREARQGRLQLDGLDLVALAETRGTPLFVYSARRLTATAERQLKAFTDRHPATTLAYASKACSSLQVLRLLRELGLAVEVNSGGELFKARAAGFADAKIVFNGVAKDEAEIAAALSPPIKAINVDSLFELERIAAVARRLGRTANIALRLVPGVETATSPGNRTGTEASKFGILESELGAALALLRREAAGLSLVGLHCHIGSQIAEAALYATAARRLGQQVRRIEQALGHRLAHVNLGGGFPLPYAYGPEAAQQGGLFRPGLTVEEIAAAALPVVLREIGRPIEVILEPGRSLVGDAAVLLSRVENAKTRDGAQWLFLDAGYNVLVESYTYKWYYHAVTADRVEAPLAPFRLVGPLCDNGDSFFDVDGERTVERLVAADPRLADCRELLDSLLVRLPPQRLLAADSKPGDLIAFLDVGAYTLDQLTPNNGRPRPEVGLIDAEGRYGVMRRRDSLVDLFFNEVA